MKIKDVIQKTGLPETYPGEVMYMTPDYVVYCELTRVTEHSYEAGSFHLVNRNTGAEKIFPDTAVQGMDFAPTGVTLPQSGFERYP